jgi:soluble lytic murein transglycosylase-like protein
MIDIARCESRYKQFDSSGKVIKNPNSTAMGIMQIMASIHVPAAEKLGLDIYTIQGNVAYAKYLFEREGTTPWLSSSACWGKQNHIARR